jgi:hypothetical protein
MRLISLALLALVGSCDQAPRSSASPENDTSSNNPAARYQMQPGVNPASIAVLDTRSGTLQNCFLVNERYHCLSQDRRAESAGGIPDAPDGPN